MVASPATLQKMPKSFPLSLTLGKFLKTLSPLPSSNSGWLLTSPYFFSDWLEFWISAFAVFAPVIPACVIDRYRITSVRLV